MVDVLSTGSSLLVEDDCKIFFNLVLFMYSLSSLLLWEGEDSSGFVLADLPFKGCDDSSDNDFS